MPKAISIGKAINIKRAGDCLKLTSPDYYLFIELTIYEQGTKKGPVYNLNPDKYKNFNTLQTIKLPVLIKGENEINYGLITVSFSISSEYLGVKLL